MIECNRSIIRFGHGERDRVEFSLTQAARSRGQQDQSKSRGSILGQDADLRDVADIGAHLRTENQANKRPRTALKNYERCLRIKCAAPRKAHNVVQKTQRAAQRAVLIIDVGIDVPAIGGRDESGGGLVVVLGPGSKFELGRERRQIL